MSLPVFKCKELGGKLLEIQGGELDGLQVPILTPEEAFGCPWADERQWCGAVHDYLANGAVPDGGCSMHRDNVCRLTGDKPCLFDEPEDSEGWAKARRWARYRTPDGKRVLVACDDIKEGRPLEVGGFLVGADVQLPIAVVKEEAAQV